MATLHNALCQEIEDSRINGDETLGRPRRCDRSHNQRRTSPLWSRRRHTYCANKAIRDDTPKDRSPRNDYSPQSKLKRYSSYSLDQRRLEATSTTGDDVDGQEDKDIISGWLYKTSHLINSNSKGHRQHRKFKLTTHSLEYCHLLHKVCI